MTNQSDTKIDFLFNALDNMTLAGYSSASGANLTSLVQILDIKPRPKSRADAVAALYRFYSDEGSIIKLFNMLSKYEKALLTCIVQSKYNPLEEDMRVIADAYKIKESTGFYSYSSSIKVKYFPKDSLLFAFFVNGFVPETFKAYLEKVIPPYSRAFVPIEDVDEDSYVSIIGRENRYRDFDMLLSFVNSQKVAATKSGGYMSKTAVLKFNSIAGYEDIYNNDIDELEYIRNAGEAIVSFGMAQLLRCAKVVDIVQDKYVPSEKASLYATLTMPEKAKFLFDSYISHGNSIIDECARISAAKLRFSRSRYNLSGPRRVIVDFLKECPAGQWIDFNQFSKEIRKADRDLLYNVGSVLKRDDYYNKYYEEAGWNDFEYCAISVMLMEYLAVLGAVDVLVEEASHSEYDWGSSAYEVEYFRVTDLGLFLFGLADSYTEKEGLDNASGAKGFVVQPNFDVVIPEGPERMRHELFFDRFAEKTVADKEVSIYKLDFKCMVSALNIGLYIREISSYCEAYSSVPVPANVEVAFSEWENQSSRIRIRTVSLIEADDLLLLEEVKNYRGMASLSEGQLASVLILAPNSEKKAKSLIEKNKRFCVIRAK